MQTNHRGCLFGGGHSHWLFQRKVTTPAFAMTKDNRSRESLESSPRLVTEVQSFGTDRGAQENLQPLTVKDNPTTDNVSSHILSNGLGT